MKQQANKLTAWFILLCCMAVSLMVACTEDEEETTGSIYGIVNDAYSGDPIAVARVTLNPSGKSTNTGSDGRYEFLDMDHSAVVGSGLERRMAAVAYSGEPVVSVVLRDSFRPDPSAPDRTSYRAVIEPAEPEGVPYPEGPAVPGCCDAVAEFLFKTCDSRSSRVYDCESHKVSILFHVLPYVLIFFQVFSFYFKYLQIQIMSILLRIRYIFP